MRKFMKMARAKISAISQAIDLKLSAWLLRTTQAKHRTKTILAGNSGEGYIDTVIMILIYVVLGALLLAGLYALFGDVVMPKLEKAIKDMFDYNG